MSIEKYNPRSLEESLGNSWPIFKCKFELLNNF